jgi:hypothetical protein
MEVVDGVREKPGGWDLSRDSRILWGRGGISPLLGRRDAYMARRRMTGRARPYRSDDASSSEVVLTELIDGRDPIVAISHTQAQFGGFLSSNLPGSAGRAVT